MNRLYLDEINVHIKYENYNSAIQKLSLQLDTIDKNSKSYEFGINLLKKLSKIDEIFKFNKNILKKYKISGSKDENIEKNIYLILFDRNTTICQLKRIEINEDFTNIIYYSQNFEKIKLIFIKNIKEIVDLYNLGFIFKNRFNNEVFQNRIDGESYELSLYISLFKYCYGIKNFKKNIVATGKIDTKGNILAINNIKLKNLGIKNELYEDYIFFVPEKNKNELINFKTDNIIYIKNINELNKKLIELSTKKLKISSKVQNIGYYDFYNKIETLFYKNNRNFNLSYEYFNYLYSILKTKKLIKKQPYQKLYFMIIIKLTLNCLHKGNLKQAELFLKKSNLNLNYFKNNYINEYIEYINSKAIYYNDNLELKKSYELMKKNKQNAEKCSLWYKLNFYNTFGQILTSNKKYQESDKNLTKSYENTSADRISRTLNYRAENYIQWGKYKKAEKDLLESLKWNKIEKAEINNKYFSYSKLSKLYYLSKNFNKSIYYAEKVLLNKKETPTFLKILSFKYLILSFYKKNELKEFKNKLIDFLYEFRNNKNDKLSLLILKIEVYLVSNDFFDIKDLSKEINKFQNLKNIIKKKKIYNKEDLKRISDII